MPLNSSVSPTVGDGRGCNFTHFILYWVKVLKPINIII